MNYTELIENEEALTSILNMKLDGYHCVKHGVGVSRIARELSIESGFSNIEVNTVSYAGLFHDASHSCNALVPDHRNLLKSLKNFYGFMGSHSIGDDIDVDLLGELILSTHSGLPGAYIEKNYSELEKIIYDADTVDGLRVLDTPEGERDYLEALRGEGYVNAGGPISFIRYRGLYSAQGLSTYGHHLQD